MMARRVLFGLLGLGMLLPGIATAQDNPLRVTAIPWVQPNPEIPHPALNGLPTQLQAIAEGGNCAGTYRFRWDWNGDGDYDDPSEGWANASSAAFAGNFAPLGLDVQFPAAPGDRLYAPKVQVECGAEVASAAMPVLVRVDRMCAGYADAGQCEGDANLYLTREVYRDRAIDRSLWWLFQQLTHRADDSLGHDAHVCWVGGVEPMYATGHLLNAFLRRGHGHGENRDADPYYRHATQCGVHGILTNLTLGDIRFDDDGAQGTDSQGLFFQQRLYAGGMTYSYVSSAWIEPIANFGNRDYVSPVGPDGVFGRTLHEVGQDLADALVHCQGADGWWHYNCQDSSTDCSTNGWAPEALRLLQRKFGVETYDWAKTAQRAKLETNSGEQGCMYGGWEPQLAGNGLVGWGWTEDETFDPGNANVTGLLQAVEQVVPQSWGLYYIYAATKGLRSFTPEIRYLPNGSDWNADYTNFLLPQQAANGSFGWSGNWGWAGNISAAARSAMTTQIIQSWLEAYAYPRAVPELAGPGTPVTFDHSWSYVLDPSVTIISYLWNVVDYLADLDLNGDGDCYDEGEHCNEDLNGDGVVRGDEIVWDYITADPNERFVYVYDDDLDWGETVRHNVTLRVMDSAGRAVDNSESVEIRISLINHAPTIVSHPEGADGRYQGYLGTTVRLDGRATYDLDEDHEPFPGDEERPPGLRDSVTSIRFDLNFDGDFDDPGEDGTNGPVELVLTDEIALGDLVAVPIRACDDGQWNGECYDDLEGGVDCSLCSYGSALVRIIANDQPPVIVPGTPCDEEGNCEPYVSVDGDPTPLDLSGSYDPEGVLGLTYQYELVEGQGHFEVSEEYQGNEGDMGPDVTYVPEGDGPRTDVVAVVVCDRGGMCAETTIEIFVPNRPPVIESYTVELEPRPPVYGGIQVTQLGDGWLRLTVVAERAPDWDAYPIVDAWDPQDDFAIDVDMFADGGADVHGTQDHVRERLAPPQQYLGGTSVDSVATVTDVDGASDSADLTTQVPPTTAVLVYWIDINGDGVWELAGDGRNSVDYHVDGDGELVVTGRVDDSNGLSTDYVDSTEIRNGAPVLEEVRVARQSDWEVLFIATAWDPENDTLTYRFDFGDGSEPVENRGGVVAHVYPEGVYRSYAVTVTVSDGQGGSVSQPAEVDFPAPAANRAPTLEELRSVERGAWERMIIATAFDPDSDPLTYRFDFGDGSALVENRGGVATHVFPEGVYRSYTVQVTVEDGRGGEASAQAEVTFTPPAENLPPELRRIALTYGARGQVNLAVDAFDPEGGRLDYRVHWGDEVEAEASAALVGPAGVHTYAFPLEGAPYVGWVEVSDVEGASVRGPFEAVIPDHPTELLEIGLDRVREGVVMVDVRASDEDGADVLRYSFDFEADGAWDLSERPGSSASHDFGEPGTYTVRVQVRDTWSGATVEGEASIEVEPWVAENQPPTIQRVQLDMGARGLAELVVEAWDPEGEALDIVVHWGDEDEADPPATVPLPRGQGTHRYAFPLDGSAYPGFVVVSDPHGASAQAPFAAQVVDAPTQIVELALSAIYQGIVQARTVAEDEDGAEGLRYAYDFDGDGVYDSEDAAAATAVYEYAEAGTYPVMVRVTDTWSGVQTTQQVAFLLEAWDQPALSDDHLEGEEGQCLVFRVAPDLAGLTAKADPEACDREDPGAGVWTWNFGDGTVRHGAEVGHRYVDDGIYVVSVEGTEGGQVRRSSIQVLVVNVAPSFLAQPAHLAFLGKPYRYQVALGDPGASDRLRLTLGEGAPAGMTLEPGEDDRNWLLAWDVPADFDLGAFELSLLAEDGQLLPVEGSDPVFARDGGHSEQRFRLTVLADAEGGGQEGEGETEADLGTGEGGEPDLGPPYEELAGSTVAGLCGVAGPGQSAGLPVLLLSLLVLGGLLLQRR